jgi:hypothetical protein
VWSIDSTRVLGHPGGKFAPTDATARKEDAALQISPHTPNAFFLLIAPIAGHFQPRRHRFHAQEYRTILQARFRI